MSDLQCPARILVCRHGEAGYSRSDVLTEEGGTLTALGRQQADALGARVAEERVAAVYTSTLGRARETGERVGSALGVVSSTVEGVQEFAIGELVGRSVEVGNPGVADVYRHWVDGDLSVGCPGAETGAEIVDRFTTAVDALADRHRGETIVLISHGGVMSLAITHRSVNASPALVHQHLLLNCAVVTVEVDADGWRLGGPWPGVAIGD